MDDLRGVIYGRGVMTLPAVRGQEPSNPPPLGNPSDLEGRVEAFLERHFAWILVSLVLVGLCLAWTCRFVQDDAFISFTYARNLVRGEGLTWFGERVEGYTNPLWVLFMALGFGLGAEPVLWSWAGGLTAYAAVLTGTWVLTRRLLGRSLPALLAVALLVSNYSFLAYATGGLETMAQTAFLVWAAVAAERLAYAEAATEKTAAALSLFLAAAVLTRPDSALPGTILAGSAALSIAKRRLRARAWLALAAPAGLLGLLWVAWKFSYYGELLPNTWYAKSGVTGALLGNGLLYVGRFFQWYLLWPFAALGLACALASRRRFCAGLAVPALTVFCWLAYVVSVGGDFMEFRLLVPIAPFFFLLLSHLVCDQAAPSLRLPASLAAAATAGVLACASGWHARTFVTGTPDLTLDSIPLLGTFYDVYRDRNWRSLGDALKQELGPANPLISLHAVGAIPFYSGLRTVDQLGLTDPFVARHGLRPDVSYARPGHQRHAPVEYLRRRGVNFIIGNPTLLPLDLFDNPAATAVRDNGVGPWVSSTLQFDREPVHEATLVLLPVRPGVGLVLWYLTPTSALDEVILARRWPKHRFVFNPPLRSRT